MNDVERAIEVLKYYKPKGNESIYERGANHKDRESFNLAISALEKQLNSGWIPVSERLPEYNKHILLYLKNDESEERQVVGYLYFTENKHLEVGNNNFSVYAGSDMPDFLIKEYVIAWQPLPEPYKEVENE